MTSRALACLCALALWSCPASAQEEAAGGVGTVPSTAAAAEAYDRGSAFYLNGDFARAAEWFETAYRLAPAPPALMQALRAQVRAGQRLRAANLALRLGGLHGDNPEARALADEVIAETAAEFVRLDVDCAECQLEIEERIWSYPAAFLAPATDHHVIVSRGDDRERHTVSGEAGQRIVLGAPPPSPAPTPVEPPSEPSVEPVVEGPPAEPPSVGVPRPEPSAGIPAWLFGVSAGLTVASGAVLLWSGLDTLAGVDDFNRMPTRPAFEAGEAREARTNVLIGTTVGLGVLSVVLAILTDWGGGTEPGATVGVSVDRRGGGAWVQATF